MENLTNRVFLKLKSWLLAPLTYSVENLARTHARTHARAHAALELDAKALLWSASMASTEVGFPFDSRKL